MTTKDGVTVFVDHSTIAPVEIPTSATLDIDGSQDHEFVDIELNDPETTLDKDTAHTTPSQNGATITRARCIGIILLLKLLVLSGIALAGLAALSSQDNNDLPLDQGEQSDDARQPAATAAEEVTTRGNDDYRVQVQLQTSNDAASNDVDRRLIQLDQFLAVGETYTTPSRDLSLTLDSVVGQQARVVMVISSTTAIVAGDEGEDAGKEEEERLCERTWEVTSEVHSEEGPTSTAFSVENDLVFSQWKFQPSCQVGLFQQVRIMVSTRARDA